MASCSIYPSRPDRSRRNRATRVSYPAEFSRKRCLLPRLSNLDHYPTWTRLDPLVFGVVLAAIEKFRPRWWRRLMNLAPWLLPPGLALIVHALYLGEGDY